MRLPLLLLAVAASAPASGQAGAPPAEASQATAEGRLIRALTEHHLGNDSAAVRHLDAVLALRPGDGAALDALAEAYTALGRPTDALYHAGLAAAASPDEPAVHARLGALLVAAGQPDAALARYETARRLSPTDAATLLALADLHAAAGRGPAEREALEALVAVGETSGAWLRLATLYAAAREDELELAALRAAVRLAPGDPTARARLRAFVLDRIDAPPSTPVALPPAGAASADEALAVVAADPRRLDAWAAALDALARTADPRAGDTADEATLLFPTVPSVLAPAADAYLAAGRPSDAARAARSGLTALGALPSGDPIAAALRARFDRVLGSISR